MKIALSPKPLARTLPTMKPQQARTTPTVSGGVVDERKALAITGSADRSTSSTASSGVSSLVALRLAPKLAVANFDWDDNIFQMPTQNWIFHKETGEPLGFGTAEWPNARPHVGKPGDYENYAVTDGSFSEFFDDSAKGNMFLRDVESALKGPEPSWQGPSWKAFTKACATAEGAKRTTIITARGHAPETIHAALCALVDKGLIKFAPTVDNVFPVAYPPLAARVGATPLNPSGGKAQVMIELLDRLQASTQGKGSVDWGFSDDDHKNFETAKSVLTPHADAGRWPNVRITLHYTGVHHAGVSPHQHELFV